MGSPAGKYLVFLIQIQLSEAPRERAQLRDIHGELQVSWGGEQGEAWGGMLQGVLEEGGSAIDLQFGIRSACGGYFPRRSHNDISTILPFSPRPCAEETSPWSMDCCMPVKNDTKSSPPTGDILVPHICGGSCLSPRWIIGGVVEMVGRGSILNFLVNHSYGPSTRTLHLQDPLEHPAPRLPLLPTPDHL